MVKNGVGTFELAKMSLSFLTCPELSIASSFLSESFRQRSKKRRENKRGILICKIVSAPLGVRHVCLVAHLCYTLQTWAQTSVPFSSRSKRVHHKTYIFATTNFGIRLKSVTNKI